MQESTTSPGSCAMPSRRYPSGRTGTDAGYQTHIREKDHVCSACRAAHRKQSEKARSTPEGKERRRAEYWRNLDAHKERNIRKFGVTMADYTSMLAGQGGVCAICGSADPFGKGRRFHVDHDHSCCPGQRSCGACVRGLLCGRCNPGLGAFDDDPDRLLAAAAYLLQTRNVLMEVKADVMD